MWVRARKKGNNKEKCIKQGNIPDMWSDLDTWHMGIHGGHILLTLPSMSVFRCICHTWEWQYIFRCIRWTWELWCVSGGNPHTLHWFLGVTNSPFLAMSLALFFPLFAPSSRVTQVTLQENNKKTSYNTRYPLGTDYYKERGISNYYLAGVSLRLTPRFAHISSSDPSTAKSSLEGPASGSSRRSATYSGTGSTREVENSSRA